MTHPPIEETAALPRSVEEERKLGEIAKHMRAIIETLDQALARLRSAAGSIGTDPATRHVLTDVAELLESTDASLRGTPGAALPRPSCACSHSCGLS